MMTNETENNEGKKSPIYSNHFQFSSSAKTMMVHIPNEVSYLTIDEFSQFIIKFINCTILLSNIPMTPAYDESFEIKFEMCSIILT